MAHRRKIMPRPLTPKQRLERLKSRLKVWESQIRVDHSQIAELQERIVHAEGMREEILREIAELEQSLRKKNR